MQTNNVEYSLLFFYNFFFLRPSQTKKGCVSVHFWKYHQPARCPMNPGTVIPARPADSECELTFEFDRFPTPILLMICPKWKIS
jgi:hypothetical protein